jgi:adenylate cyclase
MLQRAADWVRSQDPELLGELTEAGVLRRDWLEGADAPALNDAPPLTVLTRALESMVEKRPSTLRSLGLSTVQVLAAASGSGADGTPKQLTVVFSDLQGFTAYTEEHGDDAARELLQRYYSTAGPIVRSRDGRIVKRLGDGLLMTFADVWCAALAALELCEDPPIDVRVRAGLHCGEVLVDADDIAGHTVNVASRVADLAAGGEVLATGEAADQIPATKGVVATAERTVEVPGVSTPLTVHTLTRA